MNITFATLPGVRAFTNRMRSQFVAQRKTIPAAFEKRTHFSHLQAGWRVNPVNGRLEMHWHADNEPPAEVMSPVEKLGMVLAVYQSGRMI
ncbi:hypothetical protein HB779_00285 (plasmid) [Phyllobacterium sp. 628]|uniref:hypothetical protein n=1 Tax=Phyllobacterium sp. 628 TaxID=2718938 RepID=UPI0016627F01|nr:hypothetical protein [Phyllobacterium sp. 628]QND50462.1 hypothetical protein HB779_00285 [Phyllobacterium sp. 628]